MKSRTVLMVLVVALLTAVLLVTAGSVAASPTDSSGQVVHVVRYGENLTIIANRYGVPVAAIMTTNGLGNPNYIYVGQRLIIPVSVMPPAAPPMAPPAQGAGCVYVVRSGDTLTSIAIRYGTTVWWLMSANSLANANKIYAGQRLAVPCPAPPPAPKPSPVPLPVPLPVPPVTGPIELPFPGTKPPMSFPGLPVYPANCNPTVSIHSPRMNEPVNGIINIVGTVDIEDFQFYKVEYGVGEQPVNWISISEVHRYEVVNGVLDVWNTNAVPEGVYILRLTAVDDRGQFPPPCDVRIIVDR